MVGKVQRKGHMNLPISAVKALGFHTRADALNWPLAGSRSSGACWRKLSTVQGEERVSREKF